MLERYFGAERAGCPRSTTAVLCETGGRVSSLARVFAGMFKIGLLGYVGKDPESPSWGSTSVDPARVPLDRDDVLPEAEQFLIHPSLDLLIGSENR